VVTGTEKWQTVQMQAFAAELGAETVFVLPATNSGDVRFRYFVPRHEMKMCVHATIAACVVLGRLGRLPDAKASVEAPLGTIEARWTHDRADVTMRPATYGPNIEGSARDRLLRALGLREDELGDRLGPIRWASTSRAKLMVPLRDETVLDALQPDFTALWELCDEFGATGAYPFTLNATGVDVAARQFPVRAGYPEDPATGVAASALAAHLADIGAVPPDRADDGWRRWRVGQGRAMGRPSLITAYARRLDDGAWLTRIAGEVHEGSPTRV
jgi:PhzF family phenazine biosynthesis protein